MHKKTCSHCGSQFYSSTVENLKVCAECNQPMEGALTGACPRQTETLSAGPESVLLEIPMRSANQELEVNIQPKAEDLKYTLSDEEIYEIFRILNTLGAVYSEAGRPQKAMKCYQKARDLFEYWAESDSESWSGANYSMLINA